MANIPSSLVTEFARVMNDSSRGTKTIMYGTITSVDPPKVQIDGSDMHTPFTATTVHSIGDRVKVEIDNHHVIVSGNFTDPSINQEAVDDTVAPVAADLELAKTDISNLGTDVAALEATVSPMAGEIEALSTDVESLSTDVSSMQTDISTLETEVDAKVDSNGVISAINTSTEGVRILEGKVTHQDISGKANKSTLISEINSSSEGTKILAGKVVHQDISGKADIASLISEINASAEGIKIASSKLTSDSTKADKDTLIAQINTSAEAVKIAASKIVHQDISGKADIASLISEINASAEGIKIASSKLTSDSTKADKDNLISQINVSPEAIQISSNKINLQGAVTMSSLASDVTDELDDKMDILDYCKSTDTTKIDGGKIFVDQAFANSIMAKDVTATGNIAFSNDYYSIEGDADTGEVGIISWQGDLRCSANSGQIGMVADKVRFSAGEIDIADDPLIASRGLCLDKNSRLYPFINRYHIQFGSSTINFYSKTGSSKDVTFESAMPSTPLVFVQPIFDTANVTVRDVTQNGFKATVPAIGSTGSREFQWIAFALPDVISNI